MTDPITPNYGLTLPTVGADTGTWGGIQNNQIFTPLDSILGTNTAITITSADVTLTATQFQSMAFTVTGTLTGNRNLIIPLSTQTSTSVACGGSFVVYNNSSGSYTLNVRTASSNSGPGISVPQGSALALYSDGTNVNMRDSALNAFALGVSSSPQGQIGGTAGSINTNAQMAYDYVNGKLYVCTTTGPSTTAIWTRVTGQPGFDTPQNLSLSTSVVSNILTVTILAANTASAPTAGNPVSFVFRDTTAANGDPIYVSLTSTLAISTVVGATQGAANGVPFRLWIAVFNNGGTPVMALINCSNSTTQFSLNETGVASTTQMSNTAISPGVFYTPSGTSLVNCAFRIVGFLTYETALAVAGTYNNPPDVVQLFGPGVKKPGDIAQTITVNSTVTTTTTSTSGAAIGPTVSITPTSKANLMRIDAAGVGYQSGGYNWMLWIVRGGTLIGGQNIYNSNEAGALQTLPYNMLAFDKPASATSVTYGTYAAVRAVAPLTIPVSSVTYVGATPAGTAQLFVTEIIG
jgi:hypothetical protein